MFKFLRIVGLGLVLSPSPQQKSPSTVVQSHVMLAMIRQCTTRTVVPNVKSMHKMCMKTGHWVSSKTKMDYGPRRKN